MEILQEIKKENNSVKNEGWYIVAIFTSYLNLLLFALWNVYVFPSIHSCSFKCWLVGYNLRKYQMTNFTFTFCSGKSKVSNKLVHSLTKEEQEKSNQCNQSEFTSLEASKLKCHKKIQIHSWEMPKNAQYLSLHLSMQIISEIIWHTQEGFKGDCSKILCKLLGIKCQNLLGNNYIGKVNPPKNRVGQHILL